MNNNPRNRTKNHLQNAAEESKEVLKHKTKTSWMSENSKVSNKNKKGMLFCPKFALKLILYVCIYRRMYWLSLKIVKIYNTI